MTKIEISELDPALTTRKIWAEGLGAGYSFFGH